MKHIKEYSELFENEVGPRLRKSNHYESGVFRLFSPLDRTGKLERIEMWKSDEKWRGRDFYYPVAFVKGFKPIRFYFLKYTYEDFYADGKWFYSNVDKWLDYHDKRDYWGEINGEIPQFYKDLGAETGLVVNDPQFFEWVSDFVARIVIQEVAEAIEKKGEVELEKEFDWKQTPTGNLLQIMGFQEVPGAKNTEHTGNIFLDHPLSPYRYSVTMGGYIRRKRKSDGVNIYGYSVRTNPIKTQKQYDELLKGVLKTLKLDVPKEDIKLLDGFILLDDKGLISAIENNTALPYSQIILDSDKIKSQWEAGGFDKEKAAKLEKRWNLLQRDV